MPGSRTRSTPGSSNAPRRARRSRPVASLWPSPTIEIGRAANPTNTGKARARCDGFQPVTKSLAAAVALALHSGEVTCDAERCPHCGGLLRVRQHLSAEVVKIVNDWVADQRQSGAEAAK